MTELRKRICFNKEWLFRLGDGQNSASPDLEDHDWKALKLPHDWSNDYPLDQDAPSGGGGGYAVTGIGWYRRHFDYTPDMKGKIVSILFDGIYMDSEVFLNGQKVGGCGYGYSSFSVDLTKALKEGDNILAVRVDNSRQPNSRWYSGSGIYRNVWMEIRPQVHMTEWGVFCLVSNLYRDNSLCALQIRADITNETGETVNAGVIHRLLDTEGNEVLRTGTALQLEGQTHGDTLVRPTLENPHLWTDKDPYLYTLISTVMVDNEPVDEVSMKIGLRTAVFGCDRGFLLNGEPVKIKGMCVHHDGGLTGSAAYKETWKRRLQALKDMGCNGIRCAHNPPMPELLDLCDEMGFLVMDEAFDEWYLTKDKNWNYYSQDFAYGSSQFFSQHAEETMIMMLHRDRNHPSVIIWSIGNEIPEQAAADGPQIARYLQDICHREDPSRMVTAACDNIVAAEPATTLRAFEEVLDVVGYNYVNRWRERAETQYDEDRKLYPKRRFIGTENASAGGHRGIYEPRDQERWFRQDYRTATHQREWLWRYMISRDFVAGDYLWTGIDYLGETRWPCRGAASGPLDTAAFPKDTYYYFRSIWNTEDLTLHIAPHWNWPGQEGEYKQVVVYTNCDRVELFINQKLVGSKSCHAPYYGMKHKWNDQPDIHPTTHDLHLSFDVVYEPGVLKAVGYKNNEIALVETVETTGKVAALKAEPDQHRIPADGICQIEISAVDEKGRPVPDANPHIRCEVVSGNARLVGMDAGDLYDLTPYSSPERRMFSGKLLAMIMAEGEGPIRVGLFSENMEDVFVDLLVE